MQCRLLVHYKAGRSNTARVFLLTISVPHTKVNSYCMLHHILLFTYIHICTYICAFHSILRYTYMHVYAHTHIIIHQMENFRLRTLPVLGTIPAVFGQAMATWVLCELGGKPFAPAPMVGIGRALRNRLLQRLKVGTACTYSHYLLYILITSINLHVCCAV